MPAVITYIGPVISQVGGHSFVFTPPIITTNSLPAGTVEVAYTATLRVSGGLPPYTWSIDSGALPTGLSMDTNGNITGTPSASGIFSFVVLVVDGNGASDILPAVMVH